MNFFFGLCALGLKIEFFDLSTIGDEGILSDGGAITIGEGGASYNGIIFSDFLFESFTISFENCNNSSESTLLDSDSPDDE